MLILADKPTAYFDVDETLVMWTQQPDSGPSVFLSSLIAEPFNAGIWLWPSAHHIERLKSQAMLGHQIVVWSHGGSTHAARVVQLLGLEPYVQVCARKPDWVYDDRPNEIVTDANTRYLEEPND